MNTKVYIFIGMMTLISVFSVLHVAHADRIDELENEIADRGSKIADIEREILEYQIELSRIGAEKNTLTSAIAELDVSRQKLIAEISLTEEQIDAALAAIEKLDLEITAKEDNIALNENAIGQTIRRINEADSQTLVESVLAYETLSEFWEQVDSLESFKAVIETDLAQLEVLKVGLEKDKVAQEDTERDLSAARFALVEQKQGLDIAKGEKDNLLAITKNEESGYQALLNEKIVQREAFEAEIAALEAELQVIIDPNSLPSPRPGVITWPVDNIILTQYFGNTPFATQNPQVYGGGGHNGVDFGVPTGSAIRSALSGTVDSWGNTDAVPGCFSYGKWILVRHNNGLATLYAHLSSINVSKGQSVATGEIIGYSGNTGYSTGPHLHFTVYANDGVQVQDFTTSINCKDARIPIAPQEAYLNPLSYLPSL